jgi:hypothetical protein
VTAVKIIDWRPLQKNSLLGFCKGQFASGLIITDITILTSERGPWASPPGKPMISRDGVVLKDEKGKVKYTPVIEFSNKEIRQRWSDAVIEAMRAAYPEVSPPPSHHATQCPAQYAIDPPAPQQSAPTQAQPY